jgi:hypothetical protein
MKGWLMTEYRHARPKTRRTRAATLLGALVLTGSVMAIDATAASAAGPVPATGELCTASENIQFFNDQGETSYTVQRGEYIRVDRFFTGLAVADGHGSGHSTRHFIWIHSNGQSRVEGCH